LSLGKGQVSCLSVSEEYLVLLVELKEVDGIPNAKQGNRDNSQLAGSECESSGTLSILSEESNKESSGDEKWGQKYETDDNVPPISEFVQKSIEGLNTD